MKACSEDILIDAGREIETPFKMKVERDGDIVEITVEQIRRLLPGKRIVAVATEAGSEILVKIYLGRTANRYAGKERSGVEAIDRAGVKTPKLLWSGSIVEGQGQVLGFEYLKDAKSLQQRWEEADNESEQREILRRIMEVIANLHHHGVVQNDLHPANFLLSGKDLYTIDGGEVACRPAPLPEPESLRNLGVFFAQFYPRYDCLATRALVEYEGARGWPQQEERLSALKDEIVKCREARKRNYIDKTFRECTRFVCESSFSRFHVCEREAYTDEMADLLEDPDKWIADGRILKDGNSATVSLVHLSDRSLVIKRYNIKNSWHGLKRAFQRSRAWNSWSNAHRMQFLGIPALKPVAMIENRIGPLRVTAYFITEYIEGPNALTCLRDMKHPNGELEALASILHELSEAQISHGDLKATNFLMAESGPIIIDLDAMQEHSSRESFERAFGKDLERFMRNWEDNPEIRKRFDGLLGHLQR